jgi:hypothetical protein
LAAASVPADNARASMARRWYWILGSSAAMATIAAIGWLWALPALVRGRIAEAAARRGLVSSVADVELGPRGIVAHDVSLASADGGALEVELGLVRVDAPLADLFTEGTRAVRRVAVQRARVRVDLDAQGLGEAWSRLRGTSRSEGEGATSERMLEAHDVEVTFRDHEGVLLHVGSAAISREPQGELQVEAALVGLLPEAPDGAAAEQVRLRATREPDGLRLRDLALRGVSVRYRELRAGEARPAVGRLERHLERVRELLEPRQRGRAARRGVPREPRGSNSNVDAAADADQEGSLARIVSMLRGAIDTRVAPGGVLRVEGLRALATTDEGTDAVLQELDAAVSVLPERALRIEGSGRPGRGGRLVWDVVLELDALRAHGQVEIAGLPLSLISAFAPSVPWHRPESGTLDGALTIEGRSDGNVQLDGSLSVSGLSLASPRLAARPVTGIALSVIGRADWDPVARRLEVERASVTSGRATAQLAGSVELAEAYYRLEARGTLPATDCDAALRAIPPDLLEDLAGLSLRGRLGARLDVRIDSRDLEATVLDLDVADGCEFTAIPAFADVQRFRGPFLHRVLEPDGTTFEMETGPGTGRWASLVAISPFLVQAVLGHEDGGFFSHHGFATPSIREALVRNLREGRYAYGASTITMQLVKNVFLHREKTLARKIQEALLTWWIESIFSKAEILELYLNVIEYGPGIYGIREASQHYFGRNPDELSPAESAYLATILPNPKHYHSHWTAREIPEDHRRRVARFIQILGSRGRYDAAAVNYGLEELTRFRFYAPGDALPEPRTIVGGTGRLPLGVGASLGGVAEELGGEGSDAEAEGTDRW